MKSVEIADNRLSFHFLDHYVNTEKDIYRGRNHFIQQEPVTSRERNASIDYFVKDNLKVGECTFNIYIT